ncbi:hypothetical protein AB0H83_44605 [Dactylosporangium sp. NPDC050688]|uniref:hypothetical protein n=1 Tax=Dactylosporangium sp. NPDC050688 TaxID=3157217 RepID=UPI0033D82457
MSTVSEPRYTGFAPIASCHWQGLANILACHPVAEPLRWLGASWGARWHGDGILYGGGRWARQLHTITGIDVVQHTAPDGPAAAALELDLTRRGTPFVAEVDAFHLPSPYQGREHVVHTVIVTDRGAEHATIVDSTNNPRPVRLTIDAYQQMRSSPCEGRTEPFKLYAPSGARTARQPTAAVVLDAVVTDLTTHAAADLAAIRAFTDAHETGSTPVNVCRPAAERFQAALLFDWLAEHDQPGAAGTARTLRELSDAWYLVHMLTTHPASTTARHRRRVTRLLHDAGYGEERLLSTLLAPARLRTGKGPTR